MLNAFSDLLCLKLCWHNQLVPTDTAESQNSESLRCGVCTTGVDYLIQCERCDTWYCHTCAKVPEQLIELLVDCKAKQS